MSNYITLVREGLRMHALSDQKFAESQLVRMEYIRYAKEAGDKFLVIKQALDGAKKTNPIHLEGLGTFTSFHQFCLHMEKTEGIKESTLKDYVKLAESWDIVLKLGMQDSSTVAGITKSMRITRTLKIIRWFERNIRGGVPEEELTLDRYWQEMDALESGLDPSVLTKQQLTQRVQDLEMQLGIARTTISQLEKELSRYKQEAKPLPAALFAR